MKKIIALVAASLTMFLCTCPAFAQNTGGADVTNYSTEKCRVTIYPLTILYKDCSGAKTDYAPAASGGVAGKVAVPGTPTCPCVLKVDVKCGQHYEKTLTYTGTYNDVCLIHPITIQSDGSVIKQ